MISSTLYFLQENFEIWYSKDFKKATKACQKSLSFVEYLSFMEYFLGENLKLVSAIFYKIFISHKMIALEKL